MNLDRFILTVSPTLLCLSLPPPSLQLLCRYSTRRRRLQLLATVALPQRVIRLLQVPHELLARTKP